MTFSIDQASTDQLHVLLAELEHRYANFREQGLDLDLTRGKPSSQQLALSDALDGILAGGYRAPNGTDLRNYGGLDGIAEANDMGEVPVIVRADEQRLRQVMTILIDNATRYSEPDSAIDIVLSTTAEQVFVRVVDYGTGISPTDLQYIFERFVRFKPRTDGAGLGLSIARALVEAHHGEIYAESEQGQGSVFTVALPRQVAK